MADLALHLGAFVLAWWLCTGLVMLWARARGRARRLTAVWGSSLAAAAAVVGLVALRGATGTGAAYAVAACVFAVWAWGELTFYTGVLAGPRRERCEPDCRGPRHFVHALGASLYHEVALLVAGAVVAWAGAGAADGLAWKLFLVLWTAHQSARLNVLLGVRNCDPRLLPEAVSHLAGFFRRRRMNPLYPVTLLGFIGTAAVQVDAAVAAAGTAAGAGEALLAAALAVAVLEHAVLMLPVPLDRLWEWAVRTEEGGPAAERSSSSTGRTGQRVAARCDGR